MRRGNRLGSEALNAAVGSTRFGIGAAMNSRRTALASQRARWADRATRALSVAIPVLAYICRYNLEINTKAMRARSDRTQVERFQIADHA